MHPASTRRVDAPRRGFHSVAISTGFVSLQAGKGSRAKLWELTQGHFRTGTLLRLRCESLFEGLARRMDAGQREADLDVLQEHQLVRGGGKGSRIRTKALSVSHYDVVGCGRGAHQGGHGENGNFFVVIFRCTIFSSKNRSF